MFVEPDPSPSSPSETPASSSFPAPNNEASFKSHPGSSQELGDHHVLALHWNTLSNTSAGDWGACDCLVRVGVQVPSHLCWQGGRWGHSFSVVQAAAEWLLSKVLYLEYFGPDSEDFPWAFIFRCSFWILFCFIAHWYFLVADFFGIQFEIYEGKIKPRELTTIFFLRSKDLSHSSLETSYICFMCNVRGC